MMDSKYTILCDADSTIENLEYAWNDYLNKKYGLNVKVSDWTEWDLRHHFPMLTQQQIFEPLLIPDFWKMVQPKPDAQKYLNKLWDKGFPIYIVTANPPETTSAKYEYVIKKHFPFIPYNNVIFIHNKQLLTGWYLIDDGLHNFSGGNYKGLLYDCPWNRKVDIKIPNLRRVYNWKAIYNILVSEYTSKEIRG